MVDSLTFVNTVYERGRNPCFYMVLPSLNFVSLVYYLLLVT